MVVSSGCWRAVSRRAPGDAHDDVAAGRVANRCPARMTMPARVRAMTALEPLGAHLAAELAHARRPLSAHRA